MPASPSLPRRRPTSRPGVAAIYIVGALARITGHTFSTNWYFYVLVMVLIMIPQMLINIFGIRLTARLNAVVGHHEKHGYARAA